MGARNAATKSCAPSATAHRSAAASARACPGSARVSPSRRVRTSIHTPTPASTNTGAQRKSPNSRSIISATSRYERSRYPTGKLASVAVSPSTSAE